jgi:hypothetical protein
MKLIPTLSLVLALAGCSQVATTSNSNELSRTTFGRGAPTGFGTINIRAASSAFVMVQETAGSLFSIPQQIGFVNNSTAAAVLCWSQDPAPTISVNHAFSVDTDGYYAAGKGACKGFGLGGPHYWAIDRGTFAFNGTPVTGGRRGTCTTTNQPCHATAECSSGTCNTDLAPTTTYLFAAFFSPDEGIDGFVTDDR